MHIDQGFAGKGGKAFKSVNQTRRLTVDERQYAEGMRAPGKLCRQVRQYRLRQRFTSAHRVPGVVIQHVP